MKTVTSHINELLGWSYFLDVFKYDESFLHKTLLKRISETHCASMDEYLALLEQNDVEGKLLLTSLTVNYSEFFRDPLAYSVLERVIFPILIQKKRNDRYREIRVWSSACAAGQEAYSLAILMEELTNGNEDKLSYRIFATDQCESNLVKARMGQYSASDLNKITLHRLNRWFTKNGEKYTVKKELQEHIDFSQFDLLNEHLNSPPASIFGDFDLVVSANLLFYYKSDYRKIIINRISSCLTTGGFFMTGEAERDILLKFNYHEVFPQSAIFQNLFEQNLS